MLRLRVNEPEIGTIVLKTEGDPARVLEADAVCSRHQAATGSSARSCTSSSAR